MWLANQDSIPFPILSNTASREVNIAEICSQYKHISSSKTCIHMGVKSEVRDTSTTLLYLLQIISHVQLCV